MNAVTGAFGYTGKYITLRLLARGESVRTLTGHPYRQNPFGDKLAVFPFDFDRPAELARGLQGVTTLYNTYWVRFPRGPATYEKAVKNTITLIRAAEGAGVRRLVHISITNASEDSSLPYFRGKGLVEKAIMGSKLSYAIVRPTVIFGGEDVLINNIAWLLRHSPVFPVFGRGDYRIQPVSIWDVAELAVTAGHEQNNMILDTVGPETYTFGELVRLVAGAVGGRARIVHLRPGLALWLARLVGLAVRDVVITRDEVAGLMAGLLVSDGPPTGRTRLSQWLAQNADGVGDRYASELQRHYR